MHLLSGRYSKVDSGGKRAWQQYASGRWASHLWSGFRVYVCLLRRTASSPPPALCWLRQPWLMLFFLQQHNYISTLIACKPNSVLVTATTASTPGFAMTLTTLLSTLFICVSMSWAASSSLVKPCQIQTKSNQAYAAAAAAAGSAAMPSIAHVHGQQ